MVTFLDPDVTAPLPPQARSGSLRRVLIGVIVLGLLLIAGGAGYLWGHDNASGTPAATSVDAGFAWDMSVHHRQAVSMAGFVRDHTTDPLVENLAYDIESSQNSQVGEFQGWLDAWGLPPESTQTQMAWMAGSGHDHVSADGLMPGLATPEQLRKLDSLTGKALDVFFLQLMINHHLGGVPMAQWAADHAGKPYVRNAAQKIVDSQSAEVVLMESMLRERGGTPLTPPD